MPKKVESAAAVPVPDDTIFELRRLFLEKLEREGDTVPGEPICRVTMIRSIRQ